MAGVPRGVPLPPAQRQGQNTHGHPAPLLEELPDYSQPTCYLRRKPLKLTFWGSRPVFLFFLRFFFFFFKRGKEIKKETERNIDVREKHISCLSHAPNQGPGPQPRHVP